jgi:subtilisin-like proprotein convertase family protein
MHLTYRTLKHISRIIILLCCHLFTYSLYGQCTLASSVPIPDDDVVTIQFAVSGLLDNNLSSPTQGICGVEIEFNHEYLGDLTITLISPSGTIVQLIGDPTTAIPTTNLSVWDIDFVPCGSAANPDPGFTPMWSNLQPWQAITPYNGTYYPYSGCLEDFNTGPANGIWQIIVEDHDQFQVGNIVSLTLIFCNPAGLVCTECNANSGVLSPPSFSICSGENIQSSDIIVDFEGNIPPGATYTYEYLLMSGNTILQNGSSFSLTPPAGNYTICGLSYLTADAVTVDALIATNDYATLSQAIANGVVCGELTASCVAVDVSAKPDTVVVTGNLCNGEVFSYRGQNYTTDGFFYQVLDGPGLCDTVVEIRISDRPLSVMMTVPDTLSCGIGTVTLSATVSGASGPFSYQWSTINGNITSPSTASSITVDQAGQYFLAVTDGVCDGSGSSIVIADQGFPQVFFEGGTITCLQPAIDINPIYIPSDANILWTGPGGFNTVQPNISVTVPGTYILNVTNQAGCTTSRSVDIGIDTTTFPVNIVSLGKNCQSNIITLANIPELLSLWQWSGPNGFSTNYWRPDVTDPGTYTLLGTYANGCTRSGTFFFDGDFSIPDISISPRDTLNCNELLSLTVSSTTAGATYQWNGPLGFSSNLSTIQINQEGNYSGVVTAPNGCQNSGSVIVDQGDDIFNYQVFSDTITCSTTTVTIGVIAPDADTFDWINYSGPGDDQPMIDVSVGGNYRVEMTDTNTGCIVYAEVFVPTDTRVPSFGYTTDTITCTEPVAELNFVPFQGYTYSTVYWELPDLSVVQGPTLMSGLPGEHRLIGISPNGCVGTWIIHIPFDTIRPFLILETDTLGCQDTVQIISQSLDSITAYQWSGPGIILSTGETISVNEAGIYHLSAFGVNGCPAEYDIIVDSNYQVPVYNLMADSLRCDQPAEISVVTADSILSYNWFDQSDQLISTDSFVFVNVAGTYRLQLSGNNRCVAYDTVTIEPVQYPVISLASDTFTCTEILVPVSVQVDIAQFTLAWVDLNGDTLGTISPFLVMQGGPYIASVSGANACETRDTISVPYDTLPPVPQIAAIGEIRCQNRDITLDGSGSSPSPLIYSWTTSTGIILSDPSLVQIQVRDTGYYYLEILRPDNGCSAKDSLLLADHPDAITLAYLDVTPPECSGDGNASITVTDIDGGVSPLQYQLNGGTLQSSPVFDGLEAGTYLLEVTDAGNCVFDTTIIIAPSFPFFVDAGPDVEIYLGESVELSGMTDLTPGDILTDQWDSIGVTLCTDCPSFEVSPLETTTYTYQLTSWSGCVKSDEVVVFVLEKGKYFIANVFSPNGDGVNDEVRINASQGIEKVLQWVIFDRWGNAVFGQTDFDPADTSVFWNGLTSTGDFVNPGVFPYVLEVQLISGKTEVYHGNITVIR